MIWQDYFKPPYSTDDYGIYMFDADENICLEYNPATTYDETIIHQVAKILNGEDKWFPHDINKATVVKNANDCFIMLENSDVITVRGWGYLTEVKHLSNKDAAKIQDDFLEFVVNKIKESQDEKDKS